MEIISPGFKEGLLYQRTELDMERIPKEYRNIFTFWVVAYNIPEGDKRHLIYPIITSKHLENIINESAKVFAKDVIIRTLDNCIFSDHRSIPKYREYPVSEGVLLYFKKECKKRRSKLIAQID